jgi:putative oxidoreductase
MTSSAFNFSNPLVPVRIMLGLLFVPHIAFKLADIAGATAFFASVGFRPAVVFVWLAIAMESISAICLIFGILTKWTGLLAAGVMCTAILAVLSIKGMVWLWNLGGIEYNVVWAGLCMLVAVYAWRDEKVKYGRNFLLIPHPAHG